MTLSDIASISSAISGVAVLISLIYLSLQTRQNSKHTRSLIQQGRIDRVVSYYMGMADRDIVAAHIHGNGGVATPETIQRRQFWLECVCMQANWQDTVSQYDEGLLSEDHFATFRVMIAPQLREPGVREFFLHGPIQDRPTRFQQFISKFLAELDAG
jgi:hypothetical protein